MYKTASLAKNEWRFARSSGANVIPVSLVRTIPRESRMNNQRGYLFAVVFVTLMIIGSLAPPTMSQANVQGQWQTLSYTMPINPIHTALLYNGNVLIVSGSGNYPPDTTYEWAIWNTKTGTITTQTAAWDMFCNGMVVLPDGRPFVVGGTIHYDPMYGQPRTAIYDVASNTLTDAQPMAHGRWYPTATVLGDGRMMVFSGLDENSLTNTTVEIYSLGSGWSPPYTASWTPPLYPRLHVLPNGTVFYSGSSVNSAIFNPTTLAWSTNVASTNYSGTRLYGSSVLFPLTPANGYKPKVMILGGGNPATATTEIIDLSAATPQWVYGPNMSAPRIEMNATILPSGKILASGGSLNDEDKTTAALNADLYDPNANSFSSAGTAAYPRLYHSVSLLMPDATVWFAGSNPARGTYEPHMEIYSPAYLFNADGSLATRPTITSVSTPVVGYGSAFTVQTPDAASISTVVLMRNGAPTHAFDMDQRYVGLSFTAGSGVLNVTGPPNGNIAPPGYYMLFLLNSAGVPSVASMVQMSAAPADVPPTGTITNPASNVSIVAGQSVSYAGTGSSTNGTIAGYSWYFEGGAPNTSNLANPGSVTYASPGSYVTTLTVTDNSGLTDPHPPTRTVTVTPAFSLSVSPASQSITQGGSTTYTVAITPANGFAGTVTFGVSGLPAGATGTFSPTSVTGSGSSTLTVTTTTTTSAGGFPMTIAAASGAALETAPTSLVIAQIAGTSTIDFGSGFSVAGLQFNGSAKLNATNLQLTDGTIANEAGSAFWTTPVNVQTFVTDFTFLLNTTGDGITFTIQNAGVTALGPSGGGLGFAGIGSSVGVKFDLFNNKGEGSNSTGVYNKGAPPNVPATNLGGGVNLHSGDVFHAHMTYNGTTLTLTITDTEIPTDTFTTSWPVNIPNEANGSSAFIGFTGGSGSVAAAQQILTWTYTPGTTTSSAATPTFTLSAGTYSGTQSVSILDATTGASIFYTLDGSIPGTAVGGSTKAYAGAISVAATETINAIATASGFTTSSVASATYTITGGPPNFSVAATPALQSVVQGATTTYTTTVTPSNGFTGTVTFGVSGLPTGATSTFNPTSVTGSGPSTLTVTTTATTTAGSYPLTITAISGTLSQTATATLVVSPSGGTGTISFGSGFSAAGLQFNGSAKLSGTALLLTDGTTASEAGTAFWATPVNVQSFTTDFTFLLNTNGDGITFTIQNAGLTALGPSGGGLGFAGIGSSVGVKFDLFNNAGEGSNSTGEYNKGAPPNVPATTLGGGVNLHSGDVFDAHMTYNGTTLTLTITDTAVPTDTFTTSWTVSIPTEVGGNTAFVGFTGGTGSAAAAQQILTWTYSH